MKQLYIIGNGFDCHHKINSSYSSFYSFLSKNYSDLLYEFDETFGDCNCNWWSDFENKLGELKVYTIANKIAFENPPDLLSDHCDRTWNDAELETKYKIEDIFNRIIKTFHEWIIQLNQPNKELSLRIETTNSVFLTFNYTKTLENLYGIEPKKILHIHGCVNDLEAGHSENFIIGHGRTREDILALNDDEISPKKLTDEELVDYFNKRSNNVEFHEQLARNAAVNELCGLRKPVETIIHNNQNFFESLKDLNIIHIYGFSFSSIDEPYIKIIADKFNNAKWEISDFNNENINKINDFLYRYNINNCEIISLNDILDKRQLKFEF